MRRKDVIRPLRLTQEEDKLVRRMAKARGQNISQFIRSVLLSEAGTMGELPESLEKQLLEIADAMKLPASTILVHFLARKFAYHTAHFNVFGNAGQPFKEFFWNETNDGMKYLVTGQELYDTLVEDYERLFNELKQLVVEMVEARKEVGLPTVIEDEKFAEFMFAL